MKKILFIVVIALVASAATAQDSTKVFNPDSPNYGIELGDYSETTVFNGDTIRVTHSVKYMFPEFSEDGLRFNYIIKSYVDGKQVSSDRASLKVPLDYLIQNKKVWEWVHQTISQTDTVIYKTLSTELYKAKVLNK